MPDGPEGLSLAKVIKGHESTVRDYLFTAYMGNERTIRDDRWKLFARTDSNTHEFFDLLNDPHELKNLAEMPRHQARIAELQKQLKHAQAEYGDTPERVAELTRRRGGRRGFRGGGQRPNQ